MIDELNSESKRKAHNTNDGKNKVTTELRGRSNDHTIPANKAREHYVDGVPDDSVTDTEKVTDHRTDNDTSKEPSKIHRSEAMKST